MSIPFWNAEDQRIQKKVVSNFISDICTFYRPECDDIIKMMKLAWLHELMLKQEKAFIRESLFEKFKKSRLHIDELICKDDKYQVIKLIKEKKEL